VITEVSTDYIHDTDRDGDGDSSWHFRLARQSSEFNTICLAYLGSLHACTVVYVKEMLRKYIKIYNTVLPLIK